MNATETRRSLAQGAAPLLALLVIVALGVQLYRVRAENARLRTGVRESAVPFVFGAPIPSLRLTYADGRSGSADQLCAAGEPVVLAFWSAECDACERLKPALDSLAARRPDVRLLLVHPAEETRAVTGVDPRVLRARAPRTEIANTFDVRTVPTLVAVGDGCRLSAAGMGGVASASLVEMLIERRVLDAPAGRVRS
jgi:thiol-disulfide isomerase/thioredoxin